MKLPAPETLERIVYFVIVMMAAAFVLSILVDTAIRVREMESRVDALEARCAK